MIYLDNAATTYPKPESVYEEVMAAMKGKGANPGRGAYAMALDASRIVYNTRNKLASFIGAEKPEEVVFTANATEALNLAIKGVLNSGDHVITSSMEHNSVIRPLRQLEHNGIKVTVINASAEGLLDPLDFKDAITKQTKLIIISHASNVCGVLQPIEEIAKIAKRHDVLFAIDAAQSLGYIPLDVKNIPVDLLAFPGHKGLYGPVGTGALYIRSGLVLQPLKEGGTGISSVSPEMPLTSPERYEAGTLNVPGIAGLGAGLEYLMNQGIENIENQLQKLLTKLKEGLHGINNIKIYGPLNSKCVPVVSFNFLNVDASEAALILDKQFNIAVRAGLHCAPLAHQTLGTLETGTLRASLGTFNTVQDINAFVQAVKEISQI